MKAEVASMVRACLENDYACLITVRKILKIP